MLNEPALLTKDPGVITSSQSDRRRVYVMAPFCPWQVQGYGTVVYERRLGGQVLGYDVLMDAGLIVQVVPRFVFELSPGKPENVVQGPWMTPTMGFGTGADVSAVGLPC